MYICYLSLVLYIYQHIICVTNNVYNLNTMSDPDLPWPKYIVTNCMSEAVDTCAHAQFNLYAVNDLYCCKSYYSMLGAGSSDGLL